MAVAAPVTPLRGQETAFERLGLDRLRLTSLGAGAGMVKPVQVVGTQAYSLFADYGEIIPHWRVVFTATYWGSRFTDATVRAFADSLQKNALIDTSGRARVDPGRVSISDIALGADMRWSPPWPPAFRPYVGGGLTAHVLNAEGKLINGTFVERALDSIAAGFSALTGVQTAIGRHIIVDVQARYDLVSGIRYGSARAGLSYLFDAPHGEGGP
ncbi:MAG: hypothetical protein NVS4B3_10940 [Gemmatimonadaceae bacterium]